MAAMRESIHFPPENLCEIQYGSGIAIVKSIRQFVENTSADINANFHAPEQQ